MTSNDAQIDVLLRRYPGRPQNASATEHLDADELNAFAEGSLPDAARARYISHLIDCNDCRQIVSQLAISSPTLAVAEAPTVASSGYSWWKRFSGFFSPMTLRYAAFAVVLITVAGVTLLVIQRPRESNRVAQVTETNQAPQSALKPGSEASPQTGNAASSAGNENKQSLPTGNPTPAPAPPVKIDDLAKVDQPKAGDTSVVSKSAKEADAAGNSSLADNKKADANASQNVPSYAPLPPTERQPAQTESRAEQKPASIASASGPRKSEEPADKYKSMSGQRGGEAGKDNRASDDELRQSTNQAQARKRVSDEKLKGPRRDQENLNLGRNANEVTLDAQKSQGVLTTKPAAPAAAEEKQPETRSTGGRKFKRQGSAWVDTKFKSSMTLKSISRGSSEFDALDSGIRSIAQQLGGEVIVVWKGKAYVIK